MRILDLDIDLTFEITRDFGSTISTNILRGIEQRKIPHMQGGVIM